LDQVIILISIVRHAKKLKASKGKISPGGRLLAFSTDPWPLPYAER